MYSNTELARAMSETLAFTCWECAVASSVEQVRTIAGTHNVNCAIVDLEAMSLAEIKELQQESGLPVICVHRIAADSMWIETMSAGAVDCCYPNDWIAIHRALLQVQRARPMALSAAA